MRGRPIIKDGNPAFTILVNSCDGFEDCWHPFFTLFERYWAQPRPPILLNTEWKNYQHTGLDIRCSQVQNGIVRRLSWSECLDSALAKIQTPLVLYLQEDYFIESPVDVKMIFELVECMLKEPKIKHIGLTHFGSGSPILPDSRPKLSRIGPRATYRISTQAGLWRKEALRSYLLPWESGWMFELFGTVRSWKRDDLFLTLNRSPKTQPIILYQHTGIVKGQWSTFIPRLFQRENIIVNYDIRGFYNKQASFLRRLKLLSNIVRNPSLVIKSLIAS